jgi:hypothetical protein
VIVSASKPERTPAEPAAEGGAGVSGGGRNRSKRKNGIATVQEARPTEPAASADAAGSLFLVGNAVRKTLFREPVAIGSQPKRRQCIKQGQASSKRRQRALNQLLLAEAQRAVNAKPAAPTK